MQDEYGFLLRFYTDVVGVPVIIETFSNLEQEEYNRIKKKCEELRITLMEILPNVQNKVM